MLANQAYAKYQNNKVMTASPAELTLMLYEGAIKFANIAIIGIENNDVMKAHTNIMKTERIIEELQAALDYKYPIANEFYKVYDYIQWRLKQANVKKDKAIMEEVLVHIRTMRDAWKEVMRITQNGTNTRVS